MLYVYKIVSDLTIYGPGKRTVIWFSGCSIHCKGCINKELWKRDLNLGMTIDQIVPLVQNDGVTLLGGEPLDQEELGQFVDKLKRMGKSIILFTGYSLNDIDSYRNSIVSKCDVVISEPYIESLKDDSLYLRGSLNQIITFNTSRYTEKDFLKENSFEISINNDGVESYGRNKKIIDELLNIDFENASYS